MSFQGDVAGLGLGELLQGLARGGREGVLTLRRGTLSARVGVQDGQILLLPEQDEDPEVWRKRCERAWVKDPDHRIDALRMREIAFASRMEGMFQLLDSEGVHFRFEPGPLPDLSKPERRDDPEPLARMETGSAFEVQTPVTCPAMNVEGLLLEHARLSDELQAHPEARLLDGSLVPRVLGEHCPARAFQRLWVECDAMSNLAEIADRLGQPIRQTLGLIQALSELGALRFADAREMLALAQRELQAGRLARAASRLAGWSRLATPGPATPGDAQLLLVEWEKGKLPVTLANMSTRDARAIVRRLDAAHGDPVSAVAHWTELRRHHRHDPLCELRLVHWQDRDDSDTTSPAMGDLLRIARKFQEMGHPWRAGIMLRLASARGPETNTVRLEIGQRMVAVGLLDEGAAWIVEAARSLIEARTPERAVAPLKQLLQISPGQREAKTLLAMAVGRSQSGKRTRRNSLIALASTLAVALLAVVKVRSDQNYDLKLEEVGEMVGTPEVALSLLEQHFGEAASGRVATLRSELLGRIQKRAATARADWMARFQECQLETVNGDPVLGLRNALALPPPPKVTDSALPAYPKLRDLLGGLLERLAQTLAEWGQPSDDTSDAAHSEQRLATLLDGLRQVVDEVPGSDELRDFRAGLDLLSVTLTERANERAKVREERARRETLEQLDTLLVAARAHAQAGDLERAVDAYDRFIALPGSERVAELLEEEISRARAHLQALVDARQLASAGRHAEALERLSTECPRPSEHLLPCRIESLPSDARVRFSDGSSRVTPFTIEVAPGEHLSLEFEHEGCESARVVLDDPSDQLVLLSRRPDRRWRTSHRVEALPVSVDNDHVLCDRAGRVVRLSSDGTLAWQRELESLGGVARTPVFLTKRAGSLLVVTEEGAAWIVDTSDGRLEGPWSADSPPISGPEPTAAGVRVGFRNGNELIWTQRIKPASEGRASLTDRPSRGHDAGLAVLRRGVDQERMLECPWNDWSVEATDDSFRVHHERSAALDFVVKREGEWSYVAWEAPSVRLPHGQLWVSDGAGVRAFQP